MTTEDTGEQIVSSCSISHMVPQKGVCCEAGQWLRDGLRRTSLKQQASHAPPHCTTLTQATLGSGESRRVSGRTDLPCMPLVCVSHAHAVCVCWHLTGCPALTGRWLVNEGWWWVREIHVLLAASEQHSPRQSEHYPCVCLAR